MKKAICIGFVAVLFLSLLLTVFLPDQSFSEMENRYLAGKPELSLQAVLSGDWMEDMETYLADQFPGRTFFVRTKATLNFLLGQREIGGAYVGADGQLFEVFSKDLDAERLSQNAQILSQFAESQTGRVYFLPVYSAFTLYPERLPAFAQEPDERAILAALGLPESVAVADAYADFLAHKGEDLYFRTDHHWTQDGAYLAYRAFCEAAGFEAVPLDAFETGRYDRFVGSMYNFTANYPQSQTLLDNPDYLEYYLPIATTHAKYYADANLENGVPVSVVYQHLDASVSNKYQCFIGGDTPVCVIESDVEGPVCLMLKESYGNAFAPFLTSHYSKIIVVDPREFNRDGKPSLDLTQFAKEQGVDDLLVINYPYMINNSYYIAWLGRLVGYSAS